MSLLFGDGFYTARWWLRGMLPLITWRMRSKQSIYLTFDDGPEPGVTDAILRLLRDHRATATFFCLGRQIERNPELLKQIVESGHTVGNHTYSHLDPWSASTQTVIDELQRTNELVESFAGVKPTLFRPPFGRLSWGVWWRTRRQLRHVMWDINGQDYLPTMTADVCFAGITRYARAGSIILLHDNLDTKERVLALLPRLLDYYERQGFTFRSLVDQSSIRPTANGKFESR